MTRIGYQLTVADRVYRAHALSLDCQASLSIPVNQCRLIAHRDISASPGAAITLTVTWGDNAPHLLFTGSASTIDRTADGTRIIAHSRFVALVCAHINLSFRGAHAGDIAAEVLTMFNIESDIRVPGIAYPDYTIADAQPVYWALADLAEHSGCCLYADRRNRAVFAPLAGHSGQAHVFRHGENLLRYNLRDQRPVSTGVDVYGHGAASFAGARAHSWLTTRAVRAHSGGTWPTPVRTPALRDLASAQRAAQALVEKHSVTRRGHLQTPLRADIGLNSAIAVSDRDGHTWPGRVTGIRHRLSKQLGAISDIDFIAMEDRG